mmetsp:Transcript_68898/g.197584  ORF Transcript_68898/g.197584 Transcript_68898/m.197584 type:complete len:274 (-) Transcript_68898:85-906(-)
MGPRSLFFVCGSTSGRGLGLHGAALAGVLASGASRRGTPARGRRQRRRGRADEAVAARIAVLDEEVAAAGVVLGRDGVCQRGHGCLRLRPTLLGSGGAGVGRQGLGPLHVLHRLYCHHRAGGPSSAAAQHGEGPGGTLGTVLLLAQRRQGGSAQLRPQHRLGLRHLRGGRRVELWGHGDSQLDQPLCERAAAGFASRWDLRIACCRVDPRCPSRLPGFGGCLAPGTPIRRPAAAQRRLLRARGPLRGPRPRGSSSGEVRGGGQNLGRGRWRCA